MFYNQKLAWKLILFVGFTPSAIGINFICFRPELLQKDIAFLSIDAWLKHVSMLPGAKSNA